MKSIQKKITYVKPNNTDQYYKLLDVDRNDFGETIYFVEKPDGKRDIIKQKHSTLVYLDKAYDSKVSQAIDEIMEL